MIVIKAWIVNCWTGEFWTGADRASGTIEQLSRQRWLQRLRRSRRSERQLVRRALIRRAADENVPEYKHDAQASE